MENNKPYVYLKKQTIDGLDHYHVKVNAKLDGFAVPTGSTPSYVDAGNTRTLTWTLSAATGVSLCDLEFDCNSADNGFNITAIDYIVVSLKDPANPKAKGGTGSVETNQADGLGGGIDLRRRNWP